MCPQAGLNLIIGSKLGKLEVVGKGNGVIARKGDQNPRSLGAMPAREEMSSFSNMLVT